MPDEIVAIESTADDIDRADDIEFVPVEAWGKQWFLISLTADDMIQFREASKDEAKKTAGIRLIIKSLVARPGGPLVLSDKHISMLRRKSEKELNKIIKKILDLNGLSVKEEDKIKND